MGGNCFDTAFSYRGGFSEPALGNWIRQRNLREQVVVVTKGGHHASVTPEMIDHELPISLERLQTDYVDLYFLHRDNPAVPAGEFVDMFNRHRAAGRVRAFGGSNWTPARLAEANAYAERNGLAGFSASSPNFTLAVWNEVPYFNCVTATDPASKAWYTEHQLPLFAWSSQAMGFFTGRYHPDDRSNDLVARTWYSDDNWQRYERAQELGRRKGVAATQIAVAYVLAQPFPTFALVGPHTIEETRTTALGLSVSLTPRGGRLAQPGGIAPGKDTPHPPGPLPHRGRFFPSGGSDPRHHAQALVSSECRRTIGGPCIGPDPSVK